MPNITFHRLSPTAQLTGTAGRPSRDVYDISEAREFVYGQNVSPCLFILFFMKWKDRRTYKQTDRQTGTQTAKCVHYKQ